MSKTDNPDNPNNPDIGRGVDSEPAEQNKKYLVLSESERKKGFVNPLRDKYIHSICGGETVMNIEIAETYAKDPKFYGSTYCCHCMKHRPVAEFVWSDTDIEVGK